MEVSRSFIKEEGTATNRKRNIRGGRMETHKEAAGRSCIKEEYTQTDRKAGRQAEREGVVSRPPC